VATASGWVTQRLSGFPKTGDSFVAGDYELHVEEMDGLRVARLKITQLKFAESVTTISRREPQKPP
jgi:CBS domain containing-hemolysin-like protein